MKHRLLSVIVVGLLGAGAARAQAVQSVVHPTGANNTVHTMSAQTSPSPVKVEPAVELQDRLNQLEALMKQDPANREAYELEWKRIQQKKTPASPAVGPVQ